MDERQRAVIKNEAVVRINELKGSEACLKIIALIDILVEEIREVNDIEQEIINIYRNQGKVSELTQLKRYITEGYPKLPKFMDGKEPFGVPVRK